MKILFISPDYPDVSKNTNMYTDLALELKEAGHDVTVVVSEEKKNIVKTHCMKENEIDVLRVRTGNLYNIRFVEKTITFLTLPFFMIKDIRKNIKDKEFDFILFSVPPVTLYSVIDWCMRRFKCPSFLMMKDIFPQNAVDINVMKKNSMVYKVFRYMEKKLYKVTSNIGCMSEKNIECILQDNEYLSKDKMSIFPNTKREDYLEINQDKEKIKESFGIDSGTKLAIFGGNLGPAQGTDFLKDVLYRYKDRKDISFVIASRGTKKEEIINYINENDIKNVYKFDFMPREKFEELLSICDIGLIFLDSRFTIPNIPSKTVSYMEQGIPIMAAVDRYTDYDKLINDSKCGTCSYSDDIEDFSKHFDNMITDDELRRQMKENGKKYFRDNLTTKVSVKLLEDYYVKITKKREE